MDKTSYLLESQEHFGFKSIMPFQQEAPEGPGRATVPKKSSGNTTSSDVCGGYISMS